MPTVPVGRLTRGQIVNLATRKAGNTALGTGTRDAQTWLNQLLFDLYTQFNWPFLNSSAALQINSASFTLPSDFLKTVDDYSLQIVSVGTTTQQFFVLEVDRATFEATRFSTQSSVTQGLPQIWTADRDTGNGLLFPDPSGSFLSCVLRYQFLPPDIDPSGAGDGVFPVFPWHFLLVQALFVQVLEFEMDSRADSERVKLNAMLEGVRQAAQPLRSVENVIPLDPAVFSAPFRSD